MLKWHQPLGPRMRLSCSALLRPIQFPAEYRLREKWSARKSVRDSTTAGEVPAHGISESFYIASLHFYVSEQMRPWQDIWHCSGSGNWNESGQIFPELKARRKGRSRQHTGVGKRGQDTTMWPTQVTVKEDRERGRENAFWVLKSELDCEQATD